MPCLCGVLLKLPFHLGNNGITQSGTTLPEGGNAQSELGGKAQPWWGRPPTVSPCLCLPCVLSPTQPTHQWVAHLGQCSHAPHGKWKRINNQEVSKAMSLPAHVTQGIHHPIHRQELRRRVVGAAPHSLQCLGKAPTREVFTKVSCLGGESQRREGRHSRSAQREGEDLNKTMLGANRRPHAMLPSWHTGCLFTCLNNGDHLLFLTSSPASVWVGGGGREVLGHALCSHKW